MDRNGESVPFLESLRDRGKATALDSMPLLTEEGESLWHLYCFIGGDILVGVDIYARQIGLPFDWNFVECINLLAMLTKKKRELLKAKTNDRNK